MGVLRFGSALLLCAAAIPLAASACATSGSDSVDGAGGQAISGAGGAGGDSAGGGGGSTGPCTTAAECAGLSGACSKGACINGVCGVVPSQEGASCDDGLYCTTGDTCQGGACEGLPRVCPGGQGCVVGACSEVKQLCETAPGKDGDPCSDGDLCSLTSHCQGGLCVAGAPVDCSFLDTLCGTASCDPAVGCLATPQNEGSACEDGKFSPCSYGLCTNGSCLSIATNEGGDCDDQMFNECTKGVCASGSCLSVPKSEGDACDDFMFNPCTQGQCTSGFCQSFPKNEGADCEDGLFCSTGSTCQAGSCSGGGLTDCVPPGGCYVGSCDVNVQACVTQPGNDGAACDAMDPCRTQTTCSAGACTDGVPANDGAPCDDGLGCTTGEVCGAGLCAGGAGATVYFSEDFAGNDAGWTLGPEWGIGPANASSGGALGADPAIDHTPTGDNGVAGVVIGGNASTELHPYSYLESPAFDTAGAGGTVKLGFYRWLNSDYDPFMHNSVDVFDGASWVNLWTSGAAPGIEDSPPNGAGWTYIEHDVTAQKNAAMRVRFGFDVGSMGVYTIGQWNVDDVRVTSIACP